MSLLVWDWLSFENNFKIRVYLIQILAREIGVGIHIVLGVLRAEFTEFDILGSVRKRKPKGDCTAVYSYQMGGCGSEQSHLISEVHSGRTGGSGAGWDKGSCSLVKGKKDKTKLPWGFSNTGGSPERLESPSLEMLEIQLDKAPKHPVLARFAFN